MKKHKKHIFKTVNVSLIFLALGVLSAVYIGNLLTPNIKPPIIDITPKPSKKELYAIEKMNQLLEIKKPINLVKTWKKYKGIIYNSPQKINIKKELIATATLNGKTITVPSININIPVGENILILTLKDKSLSSTFGGNKATGEVIYKILVKDGIEKDKIRYSTVADTELYTGLTSTSGNTNGGDIISTRIKKGTGLHHATLNFTIDDILIDYDNSFYVKGTVDNNNNFTEIGSHIKLIENEITLIPINGAYHLYLVDLLGNEYHSYLQLGSYDWRKTLGDNLLE